MAEGCRVELVRTGRVLKIVAEGQFEKTAALTAAGRALVLAGRHGIRRFLFDARRCTNPASIITNYDFAYRTLTALRVPREVRAAILVAPEDHSYDLVETLCLNAGYSVKLFRDESEAAAWLAGGGRAPRGSGEGGDAWEER